MGFERKKVATALAYLVGTGSVMSLSAAHAQAPDIRVEVTGPTSSASRRKTRFPFR